MPGSMTQVYDPKDECPVFRTLAGGHGRPPVVKEILLDTAITSDSDRLLYLTSEPRNLTAGCRQGTLAISVNRPADYAMTSWDGNPDCGLKMQVSNRAANTTSRGAVRGIDLNARNRSSGSITWINGVYITAENSTGCTIADVTGAEIHAKNNGTASGSVKVLRVYDESQSSTGTNYAISIDCTNNSPFAREFCVHINSGASSSWTNGITFDGNITNTFDFADTDGTNGATTKGSDYSLSEPRVKIKCDVGGTTYYLIGYTTAT